MERDQGISGDEDQPFGLGLSDQHPVYRVPVVHREIPRLLGVMEGQRQVGEASFFSHRQQMVRGGHVSLRPLDGDLPSGDGTDEDVVPRVGDRVAGAFSQSRDIGQAPYERAGVQQQAEHRQPSSGNIFGFHIASVNSSSSSSKSSDIRICPSSPPSFRTCMEVPVPPRLSWIPAFAGMTTMGQPACANRPEVPCTTAGAGSLTLGGFQVFAVRLQPQPGLTGPGDHDPFTLPRQLPQPRELRFRLVHVDLHPGSPIAKLS